MTMSPKTIHITDDRMLKLMKYCIANKLPGAGTKAEWFETIGGHKSNLTNITTGAQGFTKDHILKACQVYRCSPDYIFGFSDHMEPTAGKIPPLDRIKLAVFELENIAKTS